MKRPRAERLFLVGIDRGKRDIWTPAESLAELAELAHSAGAVVAGQNLLRLRRTSPRLLIGSGQCQQVIAEAKAVEAEAIVFDEELQPRQQRNLERAARIKILDRTALILDIFAAHAKSAEGKLQVARAQVDYLLPRLSQLWVQFSRTGGGIGTRGPGETQIEVDRRELRARLARLDRQIEGVRSRRAIARANRADSGAVVALVGYTNAGKTVLHSALSNSGGSGRGQMFATLDPLVRRTVLPGGRRILLVDTVGFINRLPPKLLAAFRATLEEIAAADLIVHVADAATPGANGRIDTVNATLEELGLSEKPSLLVLNKSDLLGAVGAPAIAGGVLVSARTGFGLDSLAAAIDSRLAAAEQPFSVLIPFADSALLDRVSDQGRVQSWVPVNDGTLVRGTAPEGLAAMLERFALTD